MTILAARTQRNKPYRAACAAACMCAVAGACGTPQGASAPSPLAYLDDASFRRSELVASLVNPSNGYSELRLAHYATGDKDDWDLLPEWNLAAEPIAAGELDAPGGVSTTSLSNQATPLALPDAVDWSTTRRSSRSALRRSSAIPHNSRRTSAWRSLHDLPRRTTAYGSTRYVE